MTTGRFNIQKFLGENKLTVCSRNLEESRLGETEDSNIMNEVAIDDLIDEVKYFSADEMEEFIKRLGNYFEEVADELSNMKDLEVAKHLHQAAGVISKRTGN